MCNTAKADIPTTRSYLFWMLPAVVFWILVACFESSGFLFLNLVVKKAFPSRMDVLLCAGAPGAYALLGIPTSIFLYLCHRALTFSSKKLHFPSRAPHPIDVVLLFGWTLFVFKLVAILLPYNTNAYHPSNLPYLLILPGMLLYVFILRFTGKSSLGYLFQWIALALLAAFLSKGAYDVFITSPRGLLVKTAAFIVFTASGCLVGLVFSFVFARLCTRRSANRPAAACLLLLLAAGCLGLVNFITSQDFKGVSSKTGQKLLVKKPPTGRNVIVVVSDCLRADHLASYGYNRVTSPFIDSLARTGVQVSTCISPSSWTLPSVTSLFTGVYPQQHGVNTLSDVIPNDLESMQSVMANHGIDTAAFVTNDFLKQKYGFGRGFNYYFDHYLKPTFRDRLTGKFFFLNAIVYFKNELLYPKAVETGGALMWSVGMPPFNHQRISAERVIDDVLVWIQAHRNRPFYTYIHLMDTHSPYDTYWYPLFDDRTYRRQNEIDRRNNVYDGRILYVDRQVQRLWKTLKQLKLADKTMLIVTADHGEEIFEHGGIGHCTTLYEEMIRVPLIMHVPGRSRQPAAISRQASSLSIPATVLDFMELPPGRHMLEKSLLKLLDSSEASDLPVYALSYTTRGRKSLKTEKEKKLFFEKRNWDQKIILQTLRLNNEWKLIVGDDGRRQLFDLRNDPMELMPIGDNSNPLFDQLQEKLSEVSAQMKIFTPARKSEKLSPEMIKKLKALGYMS